jgi:phytoene dehydrogenase-like protein
MASPYHAIVIGAGLNGLAAATVLGGAGRRVLVIEERDAPGGACRPRTIAPGFRVDPVVEAGWISPALARALVLDRQGVDRLPDEATAAAIGVGPDPLVLRRDQAATLDVLRRRSEKDARAWPAFAASLARLAEFLEWLAHRPPPRPVGGDWRELAALAAVGRRGRALGRAGMAELARLLPMAVADLVDERFDSADLKALIAAAGIAGVQQGPRSGGTTCVLLHGLIGAGVGALRMRSRVRGGAAAVADALANAARAKGAVLRTGTRVAAIRLAGERVAGITLATGEEIPATLVLSSADVQATLVELADPGALDPEFVRAVLNVRCRGVVSRVHLALDALPQFRGLPVDALGGPIALTSGLDGIERAYDDAKYGRASDRLVLEIRVPSVLDPTLAPPGRHVMSVAVQYTPYRLRGREWDAREKSALMDRVMAVLAEHAPGLPGSVIQAEVLTPIDLEREYALPEGQADHAELALDQLLFMRPVPDCARYRTPIEGLFLCGAGQHPGRHVAGGAGYLAARAALASRTSRRE